jgi:hypothetical protein
LNAADGIVIELPSFGKTAQHGLYGFETTAHGLDYVIAGCDAREGKFNQQRSANSEDANPQEPEGIFDVHLGRDGAVP